MAVTIVDLYCGAGGVGLAVERLRAEWDVDVRHVGVDTADRSDTYPGAFVRGDASRPPIDPDTEIDLLWLSPPCKAYSQLSNITIDDPRELYPTFDELRVREVIAELDPAEYIIENVRSCEDLREPTKINGYGVGLDFPWQRNFETSFWCPVKWGHGERDPDAFTDHGDIKNDSAFARAKGVPEAWTVGEIRSAIPTPYVRHLLHYCPSVPETAPSG